MKENRIHTLDEEITFDDEIKDYTKVKLLRAETDAATSGNQKDREVMKQAKKAQKQVERSDGKPQHCNRPLGLLLTRRSENATVTLCHTGTRDIEAESSRADIVVAAAGVPGMVHAQAVKPGAAVLDVGITRTDAGLTGDVAADVLEVAGWVAPMPGGTGPMTRAMRLADTVESEERAAS